MRFRALPLLLACALVRPCGANEALDWNDAARETLAAAGASSPAAARALAIAHAALFDAVIAVSTAPSRRPYLYPGAASDRGGAAAAAAAQAAHDALSELFPERRRELDARLAT